MDCPVRAVPIFSAMTVVCCELSCSQSVLCPQFNFFRYLAVHGIVGTGSQVTGSTISVGSGRVTGQCDRPGV